VRRAPKSPGPRAGALAGALALAALAAPGCIVVTLAPLYDGQTIEFEEGLLGTWVNAEDGQTLVVARGQWRSYAIAWTDGQGTQALTAHLTRVGGERFVDAMPAVGEDRGPLLVGGHVVARLRRAANALTLEMLDDGWMRGAARRGALPRRHWALDERETLLLTMSTADLRAWLARHVADDGLFAPPLSFERKPD